MNRGFYSKLAMQNIKNNSKTYVPYLLTSICTVAMYYIMHIVANDKEIGNGSLHTVLVMGVAVVAIFSAIFLFYTNSFLIKRRKKELGLYNILGMEKKHIAKIITLETLFTSSVSIIFGMGLGVLFSKLILMFLMKLLSFEVRMGFDISWEAVWVTTVLFAGIFFLILISNLMQIHLSKPIELLKGGQVGEKEPKTKLITAIVGILCLGVAYYIALTTESPLRAIYLFLVAVILVIFGTYFIFSAGSIALLKILRKNKNYYYQTKHFTSVSGMMYRMKQNSAGLANICILSTAVLVMLSTTTSLFIGLDDALETRYPSDVAVTVHKVEHKDLKKIDSIIAENLENSGLKAENVASIRYKTFMTLQSGDKFERRPKENGSVTYNGISKDISVICFLTLDDYNKTQKRNVSLGENDMLLYCANGEIAGEYVNFNGKEYKIKERLDHINAISDTTSNYSKTYYAVVRDEAEIKKVNFVLSDQPDKYDGLEYSYNFDVTAEADQKIALGNSVAKDLLESGYEEGIDTREGARGDFLCIYGGLFFLGIFLGTMFMMATVLTMYYKQISEGYDDKERFGIMQKVGMSREEIKKSIHSQVLMVFFLPIVTAVIHICFGFKVITKLLAVLNLTNVTLFLICTIATVVIFAIFYAIVYALTAKVYYKIVE